MILFNKTFNFYLKLNLLLEAKMSKMSIFQKITQKLFNTILNSQQNNLSKNAFNGQQKQHFQMQMNTSKISDLDQWIEQRLNKFVNTDFYKQQVKYSLQEQNIDKKDKYTQDKNKQNKNNHQIPGLKADYNTLLDLSNKEYSQNEQQQTDKLYKYSNKLKRDISIKQIQKHYYRSINKNSKLQESTNEYQNSKDLMIKFDCSSGKQTKQTKQSMYCLFKSKQSIEKSIIQNKPQQITIINPSLIIFNQIIQLNQQKANEQEYRQQQIQTSKIKQLFCQNIPQSVFITTSNLSTLLSNIVIFHFIYYFDWIQYFQDQLTTINIHSNDTQIGLKDQLTKISNLQQKINMLGNRKTFTKIITTQYIYHQYSSLFTFIKTITNFYDKITNQLKINLKQTNYLQIQTLFQKFLSENHNIIQNQVQFLLSNYHFHIVKPDQINQYQQISFSFRNLNLFQYQTYDLEILNPSNIQQKILIQAKHLKNVQNIYYFHKKGCIDEQTYHLIVKRLDQKQIYNKNHQKVLQFTPTYSEIVRIIRNQQITVSLMLLNTKKLKNPSNRALIKKTHLFEKHIVQLNRFNQQIQKFSSKQNVLFHNPHSISLENKGKLFEQVKIIQRFCLLSDFQLIQMLNNGILLELDSNQTFYNPNVCFQYVFIIIDGICIKKAQKNNQHISFLTKSDLFGWQHFLYAKQAQISQKSIENDKKINQKNCNVWALSQKVTVLRVEINFLEYLLYDKLEDLIKMQKKSIQNPQKQIKMLNQMLMPQNNRKFDQIQIKIFQNPIFLYKVLSVIKKKIKNFIKQCWQTNNYYHLKVNFEEDKSIQLLLNNYPNLISII